MSAHAPPTSSRAFRPAPCRATAHGQPPKSRFSSAGSTQARSHEQMRLTVLGAGHIGLMAQPDPHAAVCEATFATRRHRVPWCWRRARSMCGGRRGGIRSRSAHPSSTCNRCGQPRPPDPANTDRGGLAEGGDSPIPPAHETATTRARSMPSTSRMPTASLARSVIEYSGRPAGRDHRRSRCTARRRSPRPAARS